MGRLLGKNDEGAHETSPPAPLHSVARGGEAPFLPLATAWRGAGVRSLLALSLLLLASCSLLIDTKQCAHDGDCVAKGAGFAGTVCSAGLCLRPGTGPDAGGDGGPPPDQCSSTAACVTANGEHSVCLSGVGRRCATLTSQDCTSVIGHEAQDNPLLIGLLVDTQQAVSADVVAAAALALNDFQQALAGVPGGQGMAPRHLVLVVCAEQENPTRAARHLVETLAVPAIIGPSSSARLLEVADKITLASGTLLMSPSASSYRLAALGEKGPVFRTAPSDALEGKVMGLVASILAPANARVVAVSSVSDRGAGLTFGLESSLSLNGESLAENKQRGAFVSRTLAQAPSAGELALAATEIVAALPNIVLLAGEAEQAGLIAGIEAAWPTQPGSSQRPSYVLAASVPSADFLESLRSAPDERLSRIRVVFPDNGRSAVFETFRRLAASSTADAPRFFEAAKTYDALYVLALAVVAGLNERAGTSVDGREMARAISAFLVRGDRVEVGATSLPGVAARLRVQSVVDLEGASGPLDFDSQGGVETNMEVGCLRRDADDQLSVSASAFYYQAGTSAAAGALRGALGPCQLQRSGAPSSAPVLAR